MTEQDGSKGPRRGGRKRVLTPSQKYENWLQPVRQETTVAEAAASQRVDRSTITRIREVAKQTSHDETRQAAALRWSRCDHAVVSSYRVPVLGQPCRMPTSRLASCRRAAR